jgi:CheY-like chemotaxis protein
MADKQIFLNSWKEIAQYLGRGVRTVQRWEAELGLPVRRPRGTSRSAVVAVTSELDQWMARSPLHKPESSRLESAATMPIHVLVVEDSVADLNACVSALQKMGIAQLDALSNVRAAMLRLEEINEGRLAKPDLIILDLNFSSESGFEVLRYWKSNPPLRSIPVIIWTGLGENEQELCRAFGVHRVVAKWAGGQALQEAVSSVKPRQPAGSPARAAASPRD